MPSFHCEILSLYAFALYNNWVCRWKSEVWEMIKEEWPFWYAIPCVISLQCDFLARHIYIFVGAYNCDSHVFYNHYLNMQLFLSQSLVQVQIFEVKVRTIPSLYNVLQFPCIPQCLINELQGRDFFTWSGLFSPFGNTHSHSLYQMFYNPYSIYIFNLMHNALVSLSYSI